MPAFISVIRSAFISIHAPREGSDALRSLLGVVRVEFQSTLPVRGATGYYPGMKVV